MSSRPPRRLSPKAKKQLLDAGTGDRTRALVKTAGVTDPEDLAHQVSALGGTVESWDQETGLLTVELPAAELGSLAELDHVVLVDTGDAYGH